MKERECGPFFKRFSDGDDYCTDAKCGTIEVHSLLVHLLSSVASRLRAFPTKEVLIIGQSVVTACTRFISFAFSPTREEYGLGLVYFLGSSSQKDDVDFLFIFKTLRGLLVQVDNRIPF